MSGWGSGVFGRGGWSFLYHPHPQEGVESTILHELCQDHHRATGRDDPLQVDDVRVLELAHDGRLRQEVPPLLVSVAPLQSFNGHIVFFLPRDFQASSTHLPKLSCGTVHKHTFNEQISHESLLAASGALSFRG